MGMANRTSEFGKDMLPVIGIWDCNNVIVAVATHDMRLGKAYIVYNPEFRFWSLKC